MVALAFAIAAVVFLVAAVCVALAVIPGNFILLFIAAIVCALVALFASGRLPTSI